MALFRILHLSDLHISRYYQFRRSLICNPRILNAILKHTRHWAKNKLDSILITGDISSAGLRSDFKKAIAFIEKLEEHGKSVILLPGNHDRFQYGWFPGSKRFDKFFKKYWSAGARGIQECSLTNENGEKLVILATDFTLESKKDATSKKGVLGQGKVNENQLIDLEKKTAQIQKKNLPIAVLWMMHFTIKHSTKMPIHDHLSLISSDSLIDKAKKLGVRHILCGHSHLMGTYKTEKVKDVYIHCAGSSACDYPSEHTTIHIRDIEVNNGKVLEIRSLDFEWNRSDNELGEFSLIPQR